MTVTIFRRSALRPPRRKTSWRTWIGAFGTLAVLNCFALVGTPNSVRAAQPPAPASDYRSASAASCRADTASLTMPLAVDWKVTTNFYGNNPASPIVDGDTVYFSSGNRIYAASVQTGAIRWKYPSDTNLDVYVQTTPAIVNGILFFSAGESLYSLNAADGKPKFPAFRVRTGVVTSPVVIADNVYFGGGDGRVYAIDSKTGEAVTGAFKQGALAGSDISSDLIYAGESLYFTTGGLDLNAMNINSGRVTWTQRLPSAAHDNIYPVVTSDTVYMVAGSSLLSLRANNGTQRWYLTLPNDASAPPAIDADGNIYIVTSERNIYALNHNGRGFWHQAPQVDYEVIAQPIISGNTLLVGTTQGSLYAYDTATGALRWNYQFQPSSQYANSIPAFTNVASRPIITGNSLLILTDDGTLTSFRHDATDTLPPLITQIEPKLGEDLNGSPPLRFSAKITDEGSGVHISTIALMIDNQPIPRRPDGEANEDKPGYTFDASTGELLYYTVERDTGQSNALPDGHHTVTITASDWMGNMATKTWTFNVDNTLRRKATNPDSNKPGGRRPGGGPAGRPGGPRGGAE